MHTNTFEKRRVSSNWGVRLPTTVRSPSPKADTLVPTCTRLAPVRCLGSVSETPETTLSTRNLGELKVGGFQPFSVCSKVGRLGSAFRWKVWDSMRVLVADDDPTFVRFAQQLIEADGRDEVVTASDGSQALELALARPLPHVLVLDWLMPKLSGVQVCRLVRAKQLPAQPYILFATSRTRREEMIECMAAGADDLLNKPVAPDLLMARLDIARQRARGGPPGALRLVAALVEASAEGDGELVFRSGARAGRVFFHDGRIAWAHLSDGTPSLLETLAPEVSLDGEVAREVVQECRRTGAPLTQTLVKWGLVGRAKLRECILSWIRGKLDTIGRMPSPQTLFLPERKKFAEDMLFSLEELGIEGDLSELPQPPPEGAPSLIPSRGWDQAFVRAPEPPPIVSAILEECMAGEGMLGAALLQRSSGFCLGRLGATLNPDTVWAQLACLNTAERQGRVEDGVLTIGGNYHLSRRVNSLEDTFIYAVAEGSKTRLAAARLWLARAAKL